MACSKAGCDAESLAGSFHELAGRRGGVLRKVMRGLLGARLAGHGGEGRDHTGSDGHHTRHAGYNAQGALALHRPNGRYSFGSTSPRTAVPLGPISRSACWQLQR